MVKFTRKNKIIFSSFAILDPRFPSDHRVTLNFGNNSPNENRGYNLKSPLVTIEPMNAIAKYDSLENFNDGKSI